jgi:pyruvate dehydrogenase E1 component
VWCFIGDGECDEPETLGAITLAAREKLDNLTWIINCNLQRLDGPVRGNGKIIQELEGIFRGAGWNVIKVIWGEDWDPLLENDESGELVRRMGEIVDGQYQKYTVEDGEYARQHFFNSPYLQELAKDLSDEDLTKLRRGGHDPVKVYAAYKAATEHKGQPTVILAKTVKGYGLGPEAEGRNPTHQQKKLQEDSLKAFRIASIFRLRKKKSSTRRSIVRLKTARKCSICTRVARRWAATCLLARRPTHRSRRR